LQVAELKAQRFGQAETAYISEISPQRLLSWHDDSLVPEPRDLAGRGHRRRYTVDLLAYLAGLRVLSDRGVPLRQARPMVETLLGRQIADSFDEIYLAESAYPDITVLIYDAGDGHQAEYQADVFVAGLHVEDGQALGDWLRIQGLTDAIIIQPAGLAFDLKQRVGEVIAGRGTGAFSRKLKTFVEGFRRAQKPRGKRRKK